ncbi:MAG: TIGR03364 family FAD-dependent oxidoreductase [Phycisphaerales bacterium]
MSATDAVVVGGGIVGLALCDECLRRGLRTTLVESSPHALGASVRNFGMIWPIGQPPGALHARALRSRARWLEILADAGIPFRRSGSLHASCAPDETAVLEEFVALHGQAYGARMIDAREACARAPALDPAHVQAALLSEEELGIDPPSTIRLLARHLAQRGADVRFDAHCVAARAGSVELASGERIEAGLVFLATGAAFRTLRPADYARSSITPCALQMMRTAAQPAGFDLGPHLAGALTLLHYKAFASCPSLPALRARLESERADAIAHGIHVLAAQGFDGGVVLGDTHEYGDVTNFTQREALDEIVLRELGRFARLPNPRIAERWMGVYAKRVDGGSDFVLSPEPGLWIVNGIGGNGMTLSFGLAAEVLDRASGS